MYKYVEDQSQISRGKALHIVQGVGKLEEARGGKGRRENIIHKVGGGQRGKRKEGTIMEGKVQRKRGTPTTNTVILPTSYLRNALGTLHHKYQSTSSKVTTDETITCSVERKQ